MIGPGRDVMGGISSVIKNYYQCGLDRIVNLCYLPTMKDGSKIKKLLIAIVSYLRFIKLIDKCDIVHVHMAAQKSFYRKAVFIRRAHRAGKKIIIHQHAADFDSFFWKQVKASKRKQIREIFSCADRVVVLSEEWESFFGTNVCDPQKITVLYNGVIMPKSIKDNYSDHNVLTLGRLGDRKGTYDLLNAIPMVISKVPDAVFYLGGDGEIENCKRIAKEKGVLDHVIFLGWVNAEVKEEYLKKCSTFILPSYKEGMPMAVLEAMSYGLATISTNAGGIPRIIEQEISGIRVNAGDTKAIASSLIKVLQNEEKRESLGRQARTRIESTFDFHTNVKKLNQIYNELMGEVHVRNENV